MHTETVTTKIAEGITVKQREDKIWFVDLTPRPTEHLALRNIATRTWLYNQSANMTDLDLRLADKEYGYILLGLDPIDAIKAVAQDYMMTVENVIKRLNVVSCRMLLEYSR